MRRTLTIAVAMGIVVFATTPRALAIDSFFDVFTELSEGPPYPTVPTQTLVSHPEGGLMVSTQIVGIGLRAVVNNSPARIAAYDAGGGGGGASVQSFFDVFTELSLDSYPIDSFFDVFLDITPPSIDKSSPFLVNPPTAVIIENGWDLFFTDYVTGGVENLHIHAQIGPGQPLMFTDAEPQTVIESWFDVWVGCRRTGGPLLPGVPLFTMTLTGNFVPEPGNVTLLLLGGVFSNLVRRR